MKITTGTLIRTVMMVLVALNMVLESLGIKLIPVDEGTVGAIVEALVEIGAIICAFWYNNSFTSKAQKADEFFKQLKGCEETEDADV